MSSLVLPSGRACKRHNTTTAYPFKSKRYGGGSALYNQRVIPPSGSTTASGIRKRRGRGWLSSLLDSPLMSSLLTGNGKKRRGRGWQGIGGQRRFVNEQPYTADREYTPDDIRSQAFARTKNQNWVPKTRAEYELQAARVLR